VELAILISLTALVASVFALLVAVGAALRVQGLQHAGGGQIGLPSGARIDRHVLAPFVGDAGLDAWLKGPTIVVVAKTTCPGCHELVASMNRQSADLAPFRVLMIERGHGEGGLAGAAEFNATWVKDEEERSKEVFRTNVSPHAFLIERGQVVGQMSGSKAVTILLGQRDLGVSTPAVATTV
jgi:hypothetical protein